MQQHFYVESLHSQVALAITINGILVFVDRFHAMPNNQLSINQWLVNGENTIDVNISINPHFEHPLVGQNASIKLVQYTGTRPDFTPSTLKDLLWTYIAGESVFPVTIHESFSIDIPYGDWIWLKAQSLTNDSIPWDSFRMFIEQMHTALSQKDYAALEPFLQTKSKELAQAYYIPIEERLANQADFFKDLFSHPSWGMQPLDFDNVEPLFHAQGRLCQFVDRKGNSLLKSTPIDDDTFSIKLYMAFIDNQWVLCR